VRGCGVGKSRHSTQHKNHSTKTRDATKAQETPPHKDVWDKNRAEWLKLAPQGNSQCVRVILVRAGLYVLVVAS